MDPKHFESLYPQDTRSQEIKKILEFVKSGLSCQLLGLPGSGRSNILGLLSYNKKVRTLHLGENQKKFHFVYMDFSEVKGRSLLDIIKFMLISVGYSLSERGLTKEYEVVNNLLSEGMAFQDELILFQSLKKSIDYLSVENNLTVVFLFDRFDQFIPDVTPQFFLNLKILRNRAKYHFSCIFSLSRALEDSLESFVYSEFHEFVSGNNIFIRLLDPVGTDFRLSYVEKITGKTTDQKTKDAIVEATGGHGKLTRLSFEAVLSSEETPEDIQTFLLERSAIRNTLNELWEYLTPHEQIFLKEHKFEERFLQEIGLISENKILIPLLESYVEGIKIEKNEEIKYDPLKNEITQGDEELSEKLSPSEFRLLKYLAVNQGKICEKEEVINAVWKDSKSQEGVTDQALDQIVYRLRKKIEADPNNPDHIKTIKGKGFKFNSKKDPLAS